MGGTVHHPQSVSTRCSCVSFLERGLRDKQLVGEQQISIVVQMQISCKRLDKGAAARMDRHT